MNWRNIENLIIKVKPCMVLGLVEEFNEAKVIAVCEVLKIFNEKFPENLIVVRGSRNSVSWAMKESRELRRRQTFL